MTAAARVEVCGVVQGVGFRPFVYRLARSLDLRGWVNNTCDGVSVVVEGQAADIERFAREVRTLAPSMAVVESVNTREVPVEGFDDFQIRASGTRSGLTLVSPDIATCPACLAEMRDPDDRRYRYPFINCTNCGPRFTIIESLPYDRPATTMKDFEMCAECAAEYGDPGDRRFHAQPDACGRCGPRLYLNTTDPSGELEWRADQDDVPRRHRDPDSERARTDCVLDAAAAVLRRGDVLALKGLGGFHLVCDATSEHAVAKLRERKRRWGKPLAVMMPDIDSARRHCQVSDAEEALLSGAARPIVLLRLRDAPPAGGTLAASVAPGLAELGVMLPYTPLHHLLLEAAARPLVMTSGNLADEPIAIDNAEALTRLEAVADAFLLHDRPIRQRYDDSVTRVVEGAMQVVRRSRGYAPSPVRLPFSTDVHILAAGPEQKNTFCLARDSYAFVSQHIGDMEDAETLEAYQQTLDTYMRLFRVTPGLAAYDLHPEYLSTKFALGLGLPSVGVQHHHAHIASVTGEHGVSERVVGLAFDGTGYGTDGTIWGGEVLLADWREFERFAHLRAVRMPGGAAAIRRPARMALGLLLGLDAGLLEHPGAAGLRAALTADELATLPTVVSRGLNSPLTSSMGRLFDAVAALIGVRFDALYEGQAAIELEAIADPSETGAYRFDLVGAAPAVIDPEPVVRDLLDDVAAGLHASVISARFHRAVVDVSVRVARGACAETGTRHVACSGGVFMNRLLLSGIARGVEDAGLDLLAHRELPVNDGGISYGQAVVAWARRDEV